MVDYAATGPAGGSPVYSAIYASINGPVGWTFQPLDDVDVTALGAFNYLVPSRGSLQVGLWNSSGTLLASQTVNAAGSVLGQSVYQPIAPVRLTAGDTYFVAAYLPGGSLWAVVVTPTMAPNGYATMAPDIQLGQVAYSSGSGFSFPGTTDGLPGYAIIAPNFQFQPVPEPATFGLMALGVWGIVACCRQAASKPALSRLP